MKTILICHSEHILFKVGLSRWLASFSDLVGLVVIQEKKFTMLKKRLSWEIGRIGPIRFFDVLLFRVYYKLFLSLKDQKWEKRKLRELLQYYPDNGNIIDTIYTTNPNDNAVGQFIESRNPDIVFSQCKFLLKENIFSIPTKGTFVMHPGICPEYRNIHGCFWAIVNDDLSKVGMSLIKIDRGIDSGQIFGYFTYPFNAKKESHIVIEYNVILENLEKIENKLLQICEDVSIPEDTSDRKSKKWGQPWLSKYLKWKYINFSWVE